NVYSVCRCPSRQPTSIRQKALIPGRPFCLGSWDCKTNGVTPDQGAAPDDGCRDDRRRDTDAVAKRKPARPDENGVDAELVDQLVEQARTAGLQLTGEGGLLQQLTKRVSGIGARG